MSTLPPSARKSLACLCLCAALLAPAGSEDASHRRRVVEDDGTVNVPAYRLPPSVHMSDEARAAMPRVAADFDHAIERVVARGDVAAFRKQMAGWLAPQIDRLHELHAVSVREQVIGGVHALVVTPAEGVPARHGGQVLINLPGGGFLFGGAASTGMTVSIPVAALGGFEVVSIDYRQAPEARFPAASEDVAAVYRALLKTHRPRDIALFGCSAGGLLAAQATAWIQREGLPPPGAIGILCASADAAWAGDSLHWQKPMAGLPSPPFMEEKYYYGGHDLADPLMSPIHSMDVLKRFPPTLLVTGSRAAELSAAINTHRLLTKAGVEADLHVWDGMGHGFFTEPDLPESREALDVIVRFFDRHLGQPTGDRAAGLRAFNRGSQATASGER